MLKQIRLQDGKPEKVVKILDTSDISTLLFVAQKGTVVYHNLHLQEEAIFHHDLCSDLQKKKGTCLKAMKATFSVTDASYLNVSRHYCLCTTNRSLHFIHASSTAQWETFRLTELPTVPTCLENNFQPTNKSKTCELLIGDHQGNVYILTFFFPRTLLFARAYSKGTQIIKFKDLKLHDSYVKCKVKKKVHNDVVDKIQFTSQPNLVLSNSKLYPLRSLVLWNLTSNGFVHFLHYSGVTCYDFSQTLSVVATGSKDFSVRLWSVKCASKPTTILEGHRAVIAEVRIHECKSTVLSFCREGEVKVFNLKTGKCLHSVGIGLPLSLHQLQFGNSALHIPLHDNDYVLVTVNDLTTKICLDDLEEIL